MSAAQILRDARLAGIDLRVDGGDLALEADVPPPADLLDRLVRHKQEIISLLRPGLCGWSAEDWQTHFDERAGIAEFDGGLPRPEAEARAFECCVVDWLNRTAERSPPGRCHGCGGAEHGHDPLLPFGTEPPGHVWLHSRCWPAWHARRKAGAVAALMAMGITPPANFPDDFGKSGGV